MALPIKTEFDSLPRAVWYPGYNVSGIYGIVNNENGKIYIGSALRVGHRWNCHRHDLRFGKHHSIYLQRAFNKDPESFEFVFIEGIFPAKKEVIMEREQFWMNFYKSYLRENGYNISPKASSCQGIKRRPEYVSRVAAALRGRRHTKEQKLAKSLRQKGTNPFWLHTPEVRRRMSISRTGQIPSPETTARGVSSRSKKKVNWKPVIQLTLDGVQVARFERVKEAEEKFGVAMGKSNIRSVCNGKRNKAFGFVWRWV